VKDYCRCVWGQSAAAAARRAANGRQHSRLRAWVRVLAYNVKRRPLLCMATTGDSCGSKASCKAGRAPASGSWPGLRPASPARARPRPRPRAAGPSGCAPCRCSCGLPRTSTRLVGAALSLRCRQCALGAPVTRAVLVAASQPKTWCLVVPPDIAAHQPRSAIHTTAGNPYHCCHNTRAAAQRPHKF